jgi:hypothetical protein
MKLCSLGAMALAVFGCDSTPDRAVDAGARADDGGPAALRDAGTVDPGRDAARPDAGPGSDGENLFVADFTDLNANGSNVYNFATRAANNVGGTVGGGEDGMQNWQHDHLPTGGPGGAPCAHLTTFEGRQQYPLGWTTPPIGGEWEVGDELFFRFAIRYDDGFEFEPSWRNKFLLHGSTGADPQSRIIAYMNTRASNLGACLGWQNYVDEDGPDWFPFSLPAHFGLTGSNDWSNFGSQYGSIGVHVNIGWTAAGPVLVTAGDAAAPPAPGPSSAPPRDGWYYGQIAARSGTGGSSLFRIWMNNNDEASPTVAQTIWHEEADPDLGVVGWDGGATIGGYVDEPSPARQGFCIAAFEIGTAFRSDFYPAE